MLHFEIEPALPPNVEAKRTPADGRLGREAHDRQRARSGQGGWPLGVRA